MKSLSFRINLPYGSTTLLSRHFKHEDFSPHRGKNHNSMCVLKFDDSSAIQAGVLHAIIGGIIFVVFATETSQVQVKPNQVRVKSEPKSGFRITTGGEKHSRHALNSGQKL